MNPRQYLLTCGLLFLVVAVAHLARLIMGWDVSVAGHLAPRWISVVGIIVPGALSFWGFSLASRIATP